MAPKTALLLKQGAIAILAELIEKPMRYRELKERTKLLDKTLSKRLNELPKYALIEQRPQKLPSGRYCIVYDLTSNVREYMKKMVEVVRDPGFKMFIKEEELKKVYIDAIRSIPDLSEQKKEIAVEKFVEKFEGIRDLISQAFLESVMRASEARERE